MLRKVRVQQLRLVRVQQLPVLAVRYHKDVRAFAAFNHMNKGVYITGFRNDSQLDIGKWLRRFILFNDFTYNINLV